MVIVNGGCGNDKNRGELTCKGASVVDYAVITTDLLSLVSDFEVNTFDPPLSDIHSPISLSIHITREQSSIKLFKDKEKQGNPVQSARKVE